MEVRTTNRFERSFKGKTPKMKKRILRTLELLAADPRHNGLHTHKVKGTRGVWEAYIDNANRVTWEWADDAENTIVLRNNCNHDVLTRSP